MALRWLQARHTTRTGFASGAGLSCDLHRNLKVLLAKLLCADAAPLPMKGGFTPGSGWHQQHMTEYMLLPSIPSVQKSKDKGPHVKL